MAPGDLTFSEVLKQSQNGSNECSVSSSSNVISDQEDEDPTHQTLSQCTLSLETKTEQSTPKLRGHYLDSYDVALQDCLSISPMIVSSEQSRAKW